MSTVLGVSEIVKVVPASPIRYEPGVIEAACMEVGWKLERTTDVVVARVNLALVARVTEMPDICRVDGGLVKLLILTAI